MGEDPWPRDMGWLLAAGSWQLLADRRKTPGGDKRDGIGP